MKVNARGFGIVLFVFGILMLSGCEDDVEKLAKAHPDSESIKHGFRLAFVKA